MPRRWTFTLLGTLLLALVRPVVASQPVRLCMAEAEVFPLHRAAGAVTDRFPGLYYEAMRMIYRHSGMPLVAVRMPGRRCRYAMQNGTVDGTMTGSYRPERERFARYPRLANGELDLSRRLLTSRYVLFAVRDSAVRWDGVTLSGITAPIGVEPEFAIQPFLKKLGARTETARDVQHNFQKMLLGRISAVAAFSDTGHALRQRFPEVRQIGPPLQVRHYFVMLSHHFYDMDPQRGEALWNAVRATRESTEFRNLDRLYRQGVTWPGERLTRRKEPK